jgi:hypothetical protein
MVKLSLIVFVICTTGCPISRSTEQKLVGSWDYNRTIDSVDTITYEANQTFFVSVRFMDDRWTQCWGRWRIEGNDIVRDITYMQIPPGDGKSHRDNLAWRERQPRHVREPIIELTSTSLRVRALVESKEELVDHTRGQRPSKPTFFSGGEPF